jgi:hypothetical protein
MNPEGVMIYLADLIDPGGCQLVSEVRRMTMSAEQDRELWDALVEAEREDAQRRADFYQNAQGRTGILTSALRGKPWQQATALGFLRDFSSDGPELVPQLVELALSPPLGPGRAAGHRPYPARPALAGPHPGYRRPDRDNRSRRPATTS